MFRKKSPKSHKKNHAKDENLLRQIGHEIGDGVKNIGDGVRNFEQKIEEKIGEIGEEINREVKVVAKKIKKKIEPFYKVSFAILLTGSIVLAYFLILVSTTPRSFPFVTNEIKSQLKKNYGDSITLENSYISFTRYGTLKISVNNVKITPKITLQNQEKQEFLIPQIDGEFSLLNLLRTSFVPRKIKVINPEIVIDTALFKSTSEDPNQSGIGLQVMSFLNHLKEESLLTKSFEIENARFVFKTPHGDHKIWVKKSQIRTVEKDNVLYISSNNQVNFVNDRGDVNLNSSCQISKSETLKCDVFLVNFFSNTIANLHPNLQVLDKVTATIDAGVSFVFDGVKFHNVNFKANASSGSFSFLEFFGEKIFFSDFAVKGQYDENLSMLNLSEIKADLKMHNDADVANPHSLNLKTHLDMSLLVSNLKDMANNRLDFYIKLANAPINELEKLWPTYLHDNGIRKWVIDHLNGGLVHNAEAKFSLVKKDDVSTLEKIDSDLNFSGANLRYDENFPPITNISAKAKFTKQDMKITIDSADVLGSKINNSTVVIDDFDAQNVMLKISGKSQGDASDSLKHANNEPKFYEQVQKYLNGVSQNSFDVVIPLSGEIDLKHSYIALQSSIKNLSNDFLKGSVEAKVKKDFGRENFVANLDLKGAEVTMKNYNIEKKSGVAGGLDLVVDFPTAKKIELKNVLFWKKENVVSQGKTQEISAKISANVAIETSPFVVTSFVIKNENFGRNSYNISYETEKKTSTEKLLLRGQVLDLAPFIQNKFSGLAEGGKKFNNSVVQVALDNLLLANSKAVKNFALGLRCANKLCFAGAVKGSYNKKQQSLFLHLTKKPEEDFARIEGQITDVGYLAEALGISNVISGGNARLKLQNKIVNKKAVLSGEIDFDDSITIYESQTVKRLATNDLFSKVRDKIFSNDKTIFDSVKLNFSLSEGKIDITSLIANNYKIGITAKGKIDPKNDVYQIKGMIVPGFIVNNLFGIGNIPIIGNVVGLLTGGEGGGVFGIRYEYTKQKGDKEAKFETSKVSSFVPTTIKNLFDLI